jgi:hypothetical protein
MPFAREEHGNPVATEAGPDVKRFERPEHTLAFEHGRLEAITMGGRLIGKGSFGPGWKWSQAAPGQRVPAHVGVVLSGRAKAHHSEGHETDLLPGDFFHLTTATDVSVVGYRPCEILYLSGVEEMIHALHRQK